VIRAKVYFVPSNNMSHVDRFLQTRASVDFEALIADFAVDANPAEPDEQPDNASPVTPAVSQESVTGTIYLMIRRNRRVCLDNFFDSSRQDNSQPEGQLSFQQVLQNLQ
jgi:hypothetical protein